MKNSIKLYTTIIIVLIFTCTSCGLKENKNIETSEMQEIQEIITPLQEGLNSLAVKQDMPESGILRIGVDIKPIPSEVTKSIDIFKYKYPGWEVQTVENIKPGGVFPPEDSPDILSIVNADKNRLYTGNYLEDLTTWFSYDVEELDTANILPGIFNVTRTGEGAVYTLPISFSVHAIETAYPLELSLEQTPLKGERPDPWTWDSFVQFTQPEMVKFGLEYLFRKKPQEFTLLLFKIYHSYIYDNIENMYKFSDPVFREIVQSVKMMYDKGFLIDVKHVGEIDQNFYVGEITEDTPAPVALFDISTIDKNIIDYNQLKYMENYIMARTVLLPLPAINGTEGKAALVMYEYAINSHAQPEVKTAAWEFIKVMMSEEVQSIEGLFLQPIMAEFNRETVESILGNYLISDEEINRFNNERIQYFSDINRLYGINDAPDITEILTGQLIPFFTDEISFDQMVESLQTEVDALSVQ